MQVGYIEHESGGVKLRKAANDRDQDKDFVRGGDFDKGTRVHLVEEATAPTGTKYWKVRRGFTVGYVKQAYIIAEATYRALEDAQEQSDDDSWSAGAPPPSLALALHRGRLCTACPARTTQVVPRITGEESDGDGDETDEDYIVDYILNHRKQGRSEQYLIVWEGYSEEEATWEPASNIGKDNPALKEYLDGL